MTPHRQRIAELLTSGQPLKWLFAGDSITHGALHTFGARDHVEHFSERIRWELDRKRDSVIKTGVSGWTVRKFLDDLDWSCLQYNAHVVSLNFGVNDCLAIPGPPADAARIFKDQLLDAISRIRQHSDPALILHVPNAILPAAGNRHKNLPPYLDVVRQVARESHAVLVDHHKDWSDAGAKINYWLSDTVHPSDIGHRAMAHTLLKSLDLWDEKSYTCQLFVPR